MCCRLISAKRKLLRPKKRSQHGKGQTIMTNTYNGWKNWETWIAELWLDNEEPNYRMKMQYFKHCQAANRFPNYTQFLQYAGHLINLDVSWYNSRISRRELTENMRTDYAEWQEHNI